MRRWHRVDPWGVRQAFTGLIILCGATPALYTTIRIVPALADEGRRLGAIGSLAVLAAFMTGWLTFAMRLYLVGIYRNERGLLIRHVQRSRLLPWSEVTGFEARAARILGKATVRNAIWLLTRDGALETPVQQRSRLAGRRKNVGPVLSPADFDLTVARLREAHADAQAGGGVVVR